MFRVAVQTEEQEDLATRAMGDLHESLGRQAAGQSQDSALGGRYDAESG
jgi:hypothetical protein